MHATEKLNQELTVTMPVKYLSAIARALVEAAEIHQAYLKHKSDMTVHERAMRESCILCYGEVYEAVVELLKGKLTDDDVATLQKVALATVESATTNKGVLN